MARNSLRTVAVIGGGASGLTAAKCLLEAGLRPTVFEQADHLGGVWSFDETLVGGGSPAYRSLHTNTPKQITAFSDFPFPAALPDFPSRAEVMRYLDAYVTRFALHPHIRYATRVDSVMPAGVGRWTVQSRSATDPQVETFDAVFVCSGMFGEPLLPEYPGLDSFGGMLLHARAYTDPASFAGQRVLVIGTGSSGIDIAVETGQGARQVWLSGRNDAWAHAVRPPGAAGGWGARLGRHLRLRLGLGVQRVTAQGVRPDAPFVMQPDRLILTDRLRDALQAGTVLPRPGITRVAGNTVYFTDGTSEEVDTIIAATGYAMRFPFLDKAIFRVTPAGLDLYRVVLHPDRPTLAFLGMSRATGAIMPLAEMQARWAARVLRGALHLPPAVAMHAAIAARQTQVAARGGNPFRVEFEPYMDLLAAEMGVLPRLWRHPRLWRALLAGPPIAARYRLDGPGRRASAASILLAGHPPSERPGVSSATAAEERAPRSAARATQVPALPYKAEEHPSGKHGAFGHDAGQ